MAYLQGLKMEISAKGIEHSLYGLLPSSPLRFGQNSGIMSVNTQARRLGCFIYLLHSIKNGRKIESLLFSTNNKELCELKENLLEHGYTSGYLTTSKSSFKHYLAALIGLSLLTKVGAVFNLTQKGDSLLRIFNGIHLKPYPMSIPVKMAFLDTIFRSDYYGIQVIVKSIVKKQFSLNQLIGLYKENLLAVLNHVIKKSKNKRMKRLRQERMMEINNCETQGKYSEHLVSSKINWLLDLNILSISSIRRNKISISERHKSWLTKYTRTYEPNEHDVFAFLLSYHDAEAEKSDDQKNESVGSNKSSSVCQMINALFQSDSTFRENNVSKMRSDQFVISMMCFYPQLVKRSIKSGNQLFPNGKRSCENWSYHLHGAARNTQSYVMRYKI